MLTSKKDNNLIVTVIDRITGEEIPHFIDSLIEKGAKNVNLIPSIGKKGRSVYVAVIDVSPEDKKKIIETLVFKSRITGWNNISCQHEYIHVEEYCLSLAIQLYNKTIGLDVPFKLVKETDDNMILLENDYCFELYKKLAIRNEKLSIYELKERITSKIRDTLEQEELKI